jgi:hypothetical protein
MHAKNAEESQSIRKELYFFALFACICSATFAVKTMRTWNYSQTRFCYFPLEGARGCLLRQVFSINWNKIYIELLDDHVHDGIITDFLKDTCGLVCIVPHHHLIGKPKVFN